MIGIYKIENIMNGKMYIGSSKKMEKRWKIHINKLKNNKHDNIYLQRDYNKYGAENFKYEIIEECDEEILISLEQKYLDTIFKLTNPNLYYYNIGNSSSGGDNLTNNPNKEVIIEKIRIANLNKEITPERRKEISDNKTGDKNPNYGKRWSPEKREKMSQYRTGLPSILKGVSYEEKYGIERAIELKKLTSDRMKLNVGEKNSNYGNKYTEERLIQMSLLNKGKKNKNVLVKSKPFTVNGEEFLTLKDAERKLNIGWATIRHRIISKNKNFDGYQYITDSETINRIIKEYEEKYFS